MADTGLLASLVGADERRIETDLDLGGMFCETFVAMELDRQISWLDDRPQLFHFRDRDQREVDIVFEHRDGSVSAIEVKASATVKSHDFRGLRHLRDKLGDRFKAGALLYTGAIPSPLGNACPPSPYVDSGRRKPARWHNLPTRPESAARLPRGALPLAAVSECECHSRSRREIDAAVDSLSNDDKARATTARRCDPADTAASRTERSARLGQRVALEARYDT